VKNILALTKRDVRLFLRDKSTVFFSFLSTLILVALYFLFISKIYADSLSGGNGFPLDASAKNFIIYLQMMAGVLILNAMSLSMGVFSTIAKDFETRKIDSFLLTPIKIRDMLLSYYAGGFAVSFVLNLFTWLLSAALIGALTGYWVSAAAFMTGVGILAAASLISASLMLLLTAIVRSSAAIGVISGISGTFLGFLCGIYMPYTFLGRGAELVGSVLPFTHLAIWMKRTVLSDACAQLGITGDLKATLLRDYFSAESVGFCGVDAPLWVTLIFCGVFALVCLLAARRILKKRIAR
jgi:multidrug/hemolysin transport system permease protein